MIRSRTGRALLAAALAVVVAAGYWFAPWKLFTSTTVDEALPVLPAATATAATSEPSASPATPSPSPVNRLLASGAFVSHEHRTTGMAQLIRLADGRTQLVLRDLSTSDGPDLRVWLTDQLVTTGGWRVFDDGRYVEVAKLKGNQGNQVYDLPADLDLAGLRSVTIWCKRFSVSFGAAPIEVN